MLENDQTLLALILVAVLSGITGLIVNTRLGKTRPKTAIILMLAIPTLTLGLFTASLINPPLPPLEKAGIHIQRGHFDEAIALLTPHHEKEQDNNDIALQLATAYFARGLLHAENDKKNEALQDLNAARSITPPDAPYLDDIQHFIEIIEKK
jgi:tetratricopeptide (TPR) repeat protein